MSIDFSSPVWVSTVEWLEAELQRLRIANDVIGAPAHETDARRGEIRMLKRILDLPMAERRRQSAELID